MSFTPESLKDVSPNVPVTARPGLTRLGKMAIGYPGAVVLATLSWFLAISSSANFSPTFDEPLHVTSGYIYWTKGDFRFHPDNGNLSQRWEALPLLASRYELPPPEDPKWVTAKGWDMSREFFFGKRHAHDADRMIFLARCMNAMWGVATGLLVYGWSRQLFGSLGGCFSLTLFIFCPLVLANQGLATSDMACTFFFLACMGCWSQLLKRVSPGRFLITGLCTAGLFLAKHSALLFLPILTLLLLARFLFPEPVQVGTRLVKAKWSRLGIFAAVGIGELAMLLVIIWLFFGWRFSALPAHAAAEATLPSGGWQKILEGPEMTLKIIDRARQWRVLPEGYLFGLALMIHMTRARNCFADGEFGCTGWWWFFPYALLIKTPLPLLLLGVLTMIFWLARHQGRLGATLADGWRNTVPLWLLILVYWMFALSTPLNIGVRHMLPIIPPLFILGGALANVWCGGGKHLVVLGWSTGLALFLYVAEGLVIWPHYLAYFNQLGGGSSQGYRHLVDSSLDWGQDLPGLQKWLHQHSLDFSDSTPVYFSYFGQSDPAYYGIQAIFLPCFPDQNSRKPLVPLQAGVYCISATNLQGVFLNFPDRWNADYEKMYRQLADWIRELDQAAPEEYLKKLNQKVTPPWPVRITGFDEFRFSRLCSYLRHRFPDAQVGYSILIFHLGQEEIKQILEGLPVEMIDVEKTLYFKLARKTQKQDP